MRRWGAGTAAVVRLLIASDDPLTGVTIATMVGVTQPRASQILRQLADHDAITATPDGYVGERTKLLYLYAARARPHLVEPESYWYSTRPLADQARRVLALASDHDVTVAFSADPPPARTARWRHPRVTCASPDARRPIEDAGLVPAEGRADASLITRWTDDQGLLSPAAPWRGEAEGLPVADPCQQWWDLLDLGGEDRAEAADRLRTAIVERTIPRVR